MNLLFGGVALGKFQLLMSFHQFYNQDLPFQKWLASVNGQRIAAFLCTKLPHSFDIV